MLARLGGRWSGGERGGEASMRKDRNEWWGPGAAATRVLGVGFVRWRSMGSTSGPLVLAWYMPCDTARDWIVTSTVADTFLGSPVYTLTDHNILSSTIISSHRPQYPHPDPVNPRGTRPTPAPHLTPKDHLTHISELETERPSP
ncbi:hypothetical protein JHW43_002619 [Diplocarpon mali]|nr:hypothetical protein JHW43_002619 [Diplocarpon mali]